MLTHLLALAFFLQQPLAPEPQRILVLRDSAHSTAALALLHRSIASELLSDDSVTYLGRRLPESLTQIRPMQREAAPHLIQADAAFDVLKLQQAAHHYSAALQLLHRIAARSGDTTALPHTLSRLAATYFLLGEDRAARTVLNRLFALEPNYEAPPPIYNPTMLKKVRAAADAFATRSDASKVTFQAASESALILLDGRVRGQGAVTVSLATSVPHYLLVVDESAVPVATVFEAHTLKTGQILRIPQIAPPINSQDPAYALLAESACHAGAFPNLNNAAILALHLDQVWVLRDVDGATLHCITFDLQSGHRSETLIGTKELQSIEHGRALTKNRHGGSRPPGP